MHSELNEALVHRFSGKQVTGSLPQHPSQALHQSSCHIHFQTIAVLLSMATQPWVCFINPNSHPWPLRACPRPWSFGR